MHKGFTLRLWLNRTGKYLLVPTVMCLVLFPLYGILHQQTVRAQMTDTAEQLATSVGTFEGYLYDVRFTANKLFYMPEFNVLAASTDSSMLSDEKNTLSAMIQLEDLTYNMQAASYSYVTFARNSLVIDNCRTHNSYDRFYPNVLEYESMTREEWVAQLSSEKMTCLPVQKVSLYKTLYPESYLTISQPFFNSLGRYTGSYTMLIREKLLLELFMPQAQWREKCLFYIVDQEGTLLMDHNFSDEQLPVEFGKSGIQSYQGKEYMFVSRAISDLNAVAVLGLPYEIYAEDLEAVNRGIWFYIIAAAAVCLLLSSLMTFWDIRQIKPLVESLGDMKEKNIHLMNKLILQKIQAHNQLTLELEQTRAQIDHSRVDALLKTGVVNSPAERKFLRELLKLTDHNYALLIPAPKERDEGAAEELQLLLTKEQLYQCFGHGLYVYSAADGDVLAILPVEDGGEAAYDRLCRTAEKLHEELNLSQPLILSPCFSQLDQLSSIYWQVRNASPQVDDRQALHCMDAQAWTQGTMPEVAALERLNEYLMAGCTEPAQSMILESFHRDITLENFQQTFFSIRGVLLGAAEKVSCEDITYLCTYDPRLSKDRQIQNLCECCLAIGSHVDALKQSHNQALQQGILRYLEENFSQPEMNAAMVADKFHISKKYVNQFLKDQTGKNWGEYLEELRLTRAMTLLRESDHSVTEIAALCGFLSQNTFYKAFRRRYGLSPSAVRREAKQ